MVVGSVRARSLDVGHAMMSSRSTRQWRGRNPPLAVRPATVIATSLANGCSELTLSPREAEMTIPATISQGSTGWQVQLAQYLLVRNLLRYDQIDGSFGPLIET